MSRSVDLDAYRWGRVREVPSRVSEMQEIRVTLEQRTTAPHFQNVY